MSLAVSTVVGDKPQVVVPKQTKLLGAQVKGLGLITTVSAELPWCFVLIEDASGREYHRFVADLKRDEVEFPSKPCEYIAMTRRIGYGLFGDVFQLKTIKFSDLTHVDRDELDAELLESSIQATDLKVA